MYICCKERGGGFSALQKGMVPWVEMLVCQSSIVAQTEILCLNYLIDSHIKHPPTIECSLLCSDADVHQTSACGVRSWIIHRPCYKLFHVETIHRATQHHRTERDQGGCKH